MLARLLSLLFCAFFMVSSNALAEYESPLSEDEAANAVEIKSDLATLKMPQADNYEYKIGPNDLLAIEVFLAKDLNHTSRVNSEGLISMPLAGAVKVAGLTAQQVERLIEAKLGESYLQDPHISVFIKEYESQKITVNGKVTAPGVFPLKGKTTLLQAISMAKGLVRLSDASETVVFRKIPNKGTVGYKIDLERVQRGELSDPILQSEDIVVVPENGSKAAFDETRKTMQFFLGFLPFI